MEEESQKNFPLGALTYQINAAFLDVYRELGHGFSETVCCRALVIVLLERGFEVDVEHHIPVLFHGEIIGTFRADIVVNKRVIVEVKATPVLEGHAVAQALNYLKAAGGGIGLVVCFGKRPEYKRLVMGSNPTNSLPLLRRHPDDMGPQTVPTS